MKRKYLYLLTYISILIFSGFLFTGCGSSNSSSPKNNSPQDSTAPAISSTTPANSATNVAPNS
ncbi:MAG: Ig-like domain-containing protein, partial [Nitrospira sp.]|nr:Ig-like domain-containing protein [Nitrospira sp.]